MRKINQPTLDTTTEVPPDIPEYEHLEEIQMTENSILSSDNITTMRFTWCEGQPLQILVDLGSTLCFIRVSTSRRLNCTLAKASPMVIRGTNGQRLISDKVTTSFK